MVWFSQKTLSNRKLNETAMMIWAKGSRQPVYQQHVLGKWCLPLTFLPIYKIICYSMLQPCLIWTSCEFGSVFSIHWGNDTNAGWKLRRKERIFPSSRTLLVTVLLVIIYHRYPPFISLVYHYNICLEHKLNIHITIISPFITYYQ